MSRIVIVIFIYHRPITIDLIYSFRWSNFLSHFDVRLSWVCLCFLQPVHSTLLSVILLSGTRVNPSQQSHCHEFYS
jgi:hypothetical protein